MDSADFVNFNLWRPGSTGSYSLKANNTSGLDAAGPYSLATGYNTSASGSASSASGQQTTASGAEAHAEGMVTTAGGNFSHSGGNWTTANGNAAFVHGDSSDANGDNTIVLGKFITEDSANTTSVDHLRIKRVKTQTSVNNLGVDANGYVVVGSASGGLPLPPYYADSIAIAVNSYKIYDGVNFIFFDKVSKVLDLFTTGANALVGLDTDHTSLMMKESDSTCVIQAVNGLILSDGNLRINTAGKGINIKEGANARMGRSTLSSGTVVVSTNKVTANSEIFLTYQQLGTITAPVGLAISARTPGVSFTILSGNLIDTSIISWLIVEPN